MERLFLSLISLHRLTQQAYFDPMTLADRRTAFEVIQHVQALANRYGELGNLAFFSSSEPLTHLITNAVW